MKPSPPQHADSRAAAPRVIPSAELLGERGQLLIEHQGERYLLRITRQGKLILTK
jgi:hemin uptake protein HemP